MRFKVSTRISKNVEALREPEIGVVGLAVLPVLPQ